MAPLRVLVVEASEASRERVVKALATDRTVDVVAETGHGADAIALCEELRPNVVALGSTVGTVDALALTEHVMAHLPTPILLVPPVADSADAEEILAAGAVDVLPPVGAGDAAAWGERLRAALRVVARVPVITHPRLRLAPPAPRQPATGPGALRVVAVGASTGGPAAVAEVLRALPSDYPVPILLVIHVGDSFGGALVRWLDALSPLDVSFAVDGDRVPARGCVRMAPPDHHLRVEGGRLRLSTDGDRHSCRPSVDVLFESVAREYGASAAGCVLTGMGRDGAAGLLALRRAGAVTFAQDEASSAVFGMPREAIARGAARRVLPLLMIGGALAALGRQGREP